MVCIRFFKYFISVVIFLSASTYHGFISFFSKEKSLKQNVQSNSPTINRSPNRPNTVAIYTVEKEIEFKRMISDGSLYRSTNAIADLNIVLTSYRHLIKGINIDDFLLIDRQNHFPEQITIQIFQIQLEEYKMSNSQIDLLKYAIENNNIFLVGKILDTYYEDINPSDNESYVLSLAVHYGYTEIVRLLLEDKRSDPTCRQSETIRIAARHGETRIVQYLLEDERSDPSANRNEAIITSSSYGYHNVVLLLLESGRIDASQDGNLALLLATQHGHLPVVEDLLKHLRKRVSKKEFLKAIELSHAQGYQELKNLLVEEMKKRFYSIRFESKLDSNFYKVLNL